MTRAARATDATAAAVLTAGYGWLLLSSVFSIREWPDTIAYALPAANLARACALTLPQLGSQIGFDRFWLFNAPWVVLAPLPAFWIAGAGRIPHLAGLVAVGLVNWTVFTIACRRLFAVQSVALAMIVAFAFLGTRGLPTADLYGQKYSVAAFGLLLVAFFPVTDPRSACSRPAWQWLAAGLLPLVHVVIPPAALVWLVAVIAADRNVRARSTLGPALFITATLAAAAWYLRPEPFALQLWPHLAFGGFRRAAHFGGLLDSTASAVASVPTWCMSAAIAAASVFGAWRLATKPAATPELRASAPAVALVVVFLVADGWRGFLDYGYFLFAAGPIVLSAIARSTLARRATVAGLATVGLANIGVSTRLDRKLPDWTTTAMTERFVADHTRAGDRVVLGPPFILAAATLPPSRTISRVVPQPYFLDTFDGVAWMRDLGACCDVYVGSEEAFRRAVRLQTVDRPLFASPSIDRLNFRGQPVIVARR